MAPANLPEELTLRICFIFFQGPETALEVNMMLKAKGKEDEFPLFTAVHRVFLGEIKPAAVIDALRNHPVHRE